MNVSAELQRRLDRLNAQRDEYSFAGGDMGEKVLTVLIGPTGSGKSTIIGRVLELCQEQGIDAGEVGSDVTRHRRNNDPDNYRTADEGITHTYMIQQAELGKLVNWSLSPTGDIYGTDPDSYPATHNFLPLLPDSLPMLQRAGFMALNVIYITSPLNEWTLHLGDRRSDPQFAGRMIEAVNSLGFAKEHLPRLHIIDNPADEAGDTTLLTRTAQKVIDIALGRVEGTYQEPEAIKHVSDMLSYAQKQRDASMEEPHGDA